MRLRRLFPEELARLLTDCGWKPVAPEMIRDCLDDGAPQNADGTVDFVAFVGWLLREMERRDG